MGSYEFRDLTDTIVGSLFEGKVIYDKTYGHVAYGCAFAWPCQPSANFQSARHRIFRRFPKWVQAVNACNGGRDDISAISTVDGALQNTAIATVDNYGYPHGMGVGSTTSQRMVLSSLKSTNSLSDSVSQP